MSVVDLKYDTETWDLAIENGDLVLVTDIDDFHQLLITRLRWFYGEYYFNIGLGVRFFEDIFVKNPNLPNIETLLKSVINETDGISKIVKFNTTFDPVLRNMTVDFEVESIYGTISEQNFVLGV